MAKLILECVGKKIRYKKIAAAVLSVLGQTADMKAEVMFTDRDGIRKLNRETRDVDRVTDVLSYPSLDGIRGKILNKKECVTELDEGKIFLGSIVLCEDRIKEQAKELGHRYTEERDYLLIHGLMHLFGYDHMTDEDKKEMREKEKAVLKCLGREDE